MAYLMEAHCTPHDVTLTLSTCGYDEDGPYPDGRIGTLKVSSTDPLYFGHQHLDSRCMTFNGRWQLNRYEERVQNGFFPSGFRAYSRLCDVSHAEVTSITEVDDGVDIRLCGPLSVVHTFYMDDCLPCSFHTFVQDATVYVPLDKPVCSGLQHLERGIDAFMHEHHELYGTHVPGFHRVQSLCMEHIDKVPSHIMTDETDLFL